jgi:hypothetical protein
MPCGSPLKEFAGYRTQQAKAIGKPTPTNTQTSDVKTEA